MSMSYADYAIAIVGRKNVVKSSLSIQTLITTSVSIVNLKLRKFELIVQLF
jgi:predicted GTPase